MNVEYELELLLYKYNLKKIYNKLYTSFRKNIPKGELK